MPQCYIWGSEEHLQKRVLSFIMGVLEIEMRPSDLAVSVIPH